jgi:hypothetical protein
MPIPGALKVYTCLLSPFNGIRHAATLQQRQRREEESDNLGRDYYLLKTNP